MSIATRISIEQYDAMIARGEFLPREKHRVELIRGEIVPIDPSGPMSPINPEHDNAVDELIEWSTERPPRGDIRLRIQGSMTIPELGSQPQPDVLWLVRKDDSQTRPSAEDVLLLIEVSDSTLVKDRGEKSRLYAEAVIRDYWIVNIKDQCIEVRREPVGPTYRNIAIYHRGQTLHSLAFPDVSLTVSRLFPE